MKKVLILAIVAVLSLGILTACGGGGGGPAKQLQVIAGENGEMKYNPDVLTVKKGETVEVTLVNKDAAQAHTFILSKYNVKTAQVQPNQQETVKFTAKDAGEWEFVCDVPGHKDGGMVGKLNITE
ncbi:MAG TPA: cupredoxin domain-containing protein [Symbiobacteriaceae bacterium]|nr:cupredoxin domain-containing protein [Symbiobacteriaceae bacterium]